jgi:hypothetical protein
MRSISAGGPHNAAHFLSVRRGAPTWGCASLLAPWLENVLNPKKNLFLSLSCSQGGRSGAKRPAKLPHFDGAFGANNKLRRSLYITLARAVLCLLLTLSLGGIFPGTLPALDSSAPAAIEIKATPIESFDPGDLARRRFGALEFRGGLVLSSPYKHFGGISALRLQPDGAHFIALSDRSYWLSGRIVCKSGRPAAISEAAMAPILNSKGKPTNWDTESIAQDEGRLYVGIETTNRIVRFNYGRKGLLARGEDTAVPAGIKSLPTNKGLEAVVFVPRKFALGGSLIGVSERGPTESDDLKAFIVGGRNPGEFAVKRTDDYDASDAALLPDGDLLLLERRFSLLRGGISMRIRRIRMNDIRPGALVDGPILIEADMRNDIDNMEALSVHRTLSGEIILSLMSDDNFSPVQRTVLLQFRLVDK